MTNLKNELWKTERKVQELESELTNSPETQATSTIRKELLAKVEEYNAGKSLQMEHLQKLLSELRNIEQNGTKNSKQQSMKQLHSMLKKTFAFFETMKLDNEKIRYFLNQESF